MKLLFLLLFATLTLGQLGALSIGSGITVYSHDIALILLLIYWMFSRKKVLSGKLKLSIAIFIGTAVMSLAANAYKFPRDEFLTGSLYLVRWILYAASYFILLSGQFSKTFMFRGLYGFGVSLAVLGLLQYVWYPYLRNLWYLGWDPHLYRVFSTLLDPNFAGLVFVLTLFLGAKQKYPLIFQGVTLVALFLTYSRSSYLAFFIGLAIWLFFTKRTRLIFIIFFAFVTILFLLPKPEGEGVKLFRTASTFARIGNWQRGIELIRESPVFGHGFNALRFVQKEKGWIDESEFPSRAGAGLDNSFQFILATTGIIGFISYVVLLFQMFRIGRKNIFVLSSLSALFVHSQFSNSLFYPWIMIWLWILIGAVERSISDS